MFGYGVGWGRRLRCLFGDELMPRARIRRMKRPQPCAARSKYRITFLHLHAIRAPHNASHAIDSVSAGSAPEKHQNLSGHSSAGPHTVNYKLHYLRITSQYTEVQYTKRHG
jgi:hypothetical protein